MTPAPWNDTGTMRDQKDTNLSSVLCFLKTLIYRVSRAILLLSIVCLSRSFTVRWENNWSFQIVDFLYWVFSLPHCSETSTSVCRVGEGWWRGWIFFGGSSNRWIRFSHVHVIRWRYTGESHNSLYCWNTVYIIYFTISVYYSEGIRDPN